MGVGENKKTPHFAGSFSERDLLVLVLAAGTTLMAFLAASVSVLAVDTGSSASVFFVGVGMVLSVRFGFCIAFPGAIGTGSTSCFAGATTSRFMSVGMGVCFCITAPGPFGA